MPQDRPIFVVGCPRSGTTLLQTMLHAHPRIAIPPETRFTLPLYDARNTFGDLREARNRRAVAHWIVRRTETRFCDLGLDPAVVIERIVEGPPSVGSAVGAVLRGYARHAGSIRWGDKRPGYIHHIDTLRRMFPDALFVHVVRDGRDCVASLMEMPWWHQDVCHAIATWATSMDHGRQTARRLPADTYLEVRYEDLVAEPESQLRRLCAFLGEDYHQNMCRSSTVAALVVPTRKSWHARTRAAISTDRTGTWRERLNAEDAALCEAVLAGRLLAHGYRPQPGRRPAARRLVGYRAAYAHRALAQAKRRTIELGRRMRETGPVADLAATEAATGERRRGDRATVTDRPA